MKKYLISEFGKEEGSRIYTSATALEKKLVAQLPQNQSKINKAISKKIVSLIAVYRVLQNDYPDKAFDIIYKYQVDVVGGGNNRKFLKLEKVPGFFGIFKWVYYRILGWTDLCGIEYGENKRNKFNFFVTRCLWVDVCKLYGCPELTVCWCHSDTAGFKGMKNLEFIRTVTLAEDGVPCDYCFRKCK